MKKIISLLIVLAMLAAVVPTALAAEITVGTGTAAASADSKAIVVNYTPTEAGTLTVTVDCGTANWSSDVMYFDSSFSIVSAGSTSGTGELTYTAELEAGINYRVRVWETDGGALPDISYTVTFSTESDDGSSGASGEVIQSGIDVPLACTDASMGIYESIVIEWTPEEDGILTVHMISADPGWSYVIEGASLLVSGTEEATNQYEVTAGTEYIIRIGCYENYSAAAGKVSYELSFTPAQLEVKKEAYVISETELSVGSNSVTLDPNAYLTAYSFTPTEAGTYTFTAPEGVELCNYGTSTFPYNVTTGSGETMTNMLTVTMTAVGQSALIGVNNADLSLTATSISVVKTADYVEDTVELQTYVNKAELSEFELGDGWTLGDYVDVYGETTHSAVMGDDGYYHLDSADGAILLVDFDYMIHMSDALNEGRGIMYAVVSDEDGKIIEKWDIGAAFLEYESCAPDGYYPLTEDLIFFYQVYGENQGYYDPEKTTVFVDSTTTGTEGDSSTTTEIIEFNEECAWMFACITAMSENDNTSDDGTAGDGTTDDDTTDDGTSGGTTGNNPETGDSTVIGLAAAAAVLSAMSIIVLPKAKKFF